MDTVLVPVVKRLFSHRRSLVIGLTCLTALLILNLTSGKNAFRVSRVLVLMVTTPPTPDYIPESRDKSRVNELNVEITVSDEESDPKEEEKHFKIQEQGKGPQVKQFIHKFHFQSDSEENTHEAYCAMHSSSFKYLIWPDSTSDLSDWTYRYKRKCPEFIVPDDISETKRVKYSLNCDLTRPKLIPSLTNKSDDVQIASMTDPCLVKFINSCCIDTKGIPNVVHYVWYFKKEMKFYMFASMISVIRYVRPCLILFHGDFLPSGKYWDYIIRIYPNIIHIKRPRPLTIFGKKIKHHEHSGDIMRIEALIQLGGIYLDTDVIILRDLGPLREFDITLCRQASGFLLNAFIMAKKNATFLHLWLDGYKQNFQSEKYSYNSMIYNNKLAYNRSDLIHVEEGTICSPPPLIGKKKYSDLRYDWSKLYGYHIYARTIRHPWSEVWIKHYNLTVGAMVRHVIYGNKELCEGPVHTFGQGLKG